MASTSLTIPLDEELKSRLERAAAEEERSSAQLAVQAIRRLLDEREARRRLIAAAVAEADRGAFVSEEAMTAWFVSLGTDEELPEPQPDVFPDGE